METHNFMEEMLGQQMRKPIELKKFLEDYKKVLESDIIPHTEGDIQIAMGLSNNEERFKTAKKKCSLKHLDQPDDVNIVHYLPGLPESKRAQIVDIPLGAHKLRTFKALVESKDATKRNPFRRSSEIYKFALFPTKSEDLSPGDECDYYNDLLISVRIYRPTRATHIGRHLEKPVFAEQFQCLGSNFLTELRDKISCVCNKHHFYDISENPEIALPEKKTDPGFFFITDTFYNDKRNPKNADYSAVIRKWAKQVSGLKTTNFKIAKMEDTRFIDLSVSLGFPQLYQHHGNCEHLFTFAQVDLLLPSLAYNFNISRRLFPRLHSFGLYNNRLCNMCGVVHYVYIVENSDRQLHDPAYLCSKCFFSFHYIEGKKIGQFRAYRLQNYTNEPEHPIEELESNQEIPTEAVASVFPIESNEMATADIDTDVVVENEAVPMDQNDLEIEENVNENDCQLVVFKEE